MYILELYTVSDPIVQEYTIHIQTFVGCNYHGFYGQLVIFEISLATFWLAST